jgi:hypothetical protein
LSGGADAGNDRECGNYSTITRSELVKDLLLKQFDQCAMLSDALHKARSSYPALHKDNSIAVHSRQSSLSVEYHQNAEEALHNLDLDCFFNPICFPGAYWYPQLDDCLLNFLPEEESMLQKQQQAHQTLQWTDAIVSQMTISQTLSVFLNEHSINP